MEGGVFNILKLNIGTKMKRSRQKKRLNIGAGPSACIHISDPNYVSLYSFSTGVYSNALMSVTVRIKNGKYCWRITVITVVYCITKT